MGCGKGGTFSEEAFDHPASIVSPTSAGSEWGLWNKVAQFGIPVCTVASHPVLGSPNRFLIL